MAHEFIGSGIAFPLRTGIGGGLALVSGEQEIVEAIRLIIGTAYGERPMRPEFGCGIHRHLFASPDSTTAGRIAFDVESSLRRWEPRIEVDDVNVTLDEHEHNTFFIEIEYHIRGTYDPRSLVFPFYTIPSEE
jgi:phage baseplate assembly protein W